MEAEGSIPMEPASTAPSSLRMSPNIFSVSTISKRRGFSTSCMAQFVHQHMVERDVRKFGRHLHHHATPELQFSSTLLLSTEVTFLRRARARWKAMRETRSIPSVCRSWY